MRVGNSLIVEKVTKVSIIFSENRNRISIKKIANNKLIVAK